MGIGQKIKCMMDKKGTNANELARRSGLTASTIYSMIHRDSSRVDIDILSKVSRALGVTADELISDCPPPKDALSAYLEGKSFSSDEIDEIIRYAEFLRTKRTS